MTELNYKNDIAVNLTFEVAGVKMPVPTENFCVRFFTGINSYLRHFDCTCKDGVYTHCEVDADEYTLHCYLDNHRLGVGQLCWELYDYVPNSKTGYGFKDGNMKVVTQGSTDYELVVNGGEGLDAKVDLTLIVSLTHLYAVMHLGWMIRNIVQTKLSDLPGGENIWTATLFNDAGQTMTSDFRVLNGKDGFFTFATQVKMNEWLTPDTPAGIRCYVTGDKTFWLYNGREWVQDATIPLVNAKIDDLKKKLASQEDGTSGATLIGYDGVQVTYESDDPSEPGEVTSPNQRTLKEELDDLHTKAYQTERNLSNFEDSTTAELEKKAPKALRLTITEHIDLDGKTYYTKDKSDNEIFDTLYNGGVVYAGMLNEGLDGMQILTWDELSYDGGSILSFVNGLTTVRITLHEDETADDNIVIVEHATEPADTLRSDLASKETSGASLIGYKGVTTTLNTEKSDTGEMITPIARTVEAELDDLHKRTYGAERDLQLETKARKAADTDLQTAINKKADNEYTTPNVSLPTESSDTGEMVMGSTTTVPKELDTLHTKALNNERTLELLKSLKKSGASLVGYKGIAVTGTGKLGDVVTLADAEPKTVEAELDDLHTKVYQHENDLTKKADIIALQNGIATGTAGAAMIGVASYKNEEIGVSLGAVDLQTYLNEFVDEYVSSMDNIDTALDKKADSLQVYTKQDINIKLSAKADSSSVPKVVTCTKAEYDALTTKDSNTFYAITD